MKTVKDNKTYYFQCDCSSQEHTLGIEFDTDEKEVCFHVQLCQYRNIFQRIVVAVKYVFGYKSKYGHWDTTLMNEEKFMDLYNLMGRYIQTAGFVAKGKLKIQKSLNDISKGQSNTAVPNGLHSEANRDMIQKRAKK
jgi:hypothetical protein